MKSTQKTLTDRSWLFAKSIPELVPMWDIPRRGRRRQRDPWVNLLFLVGLKSVVVRLFWDMRKYLTRSDGEYRSTALNQNQRLLPDSKRPRVLFHRRLHDLQRQRVANIVRLDWKLGQPFRTWGYWVSLERRKEERTRMHMISPVESNRIRLWRSFVKEWQKLTSTGNLDRIEVSWSW